jgi:hypothetical protein
MRVVLEQEDTDGNFQISVTDSGPKVLALGTATSNGFRSFDVRGSMASLRGRTAILTLVLLYPSLWLASPRNLPFQPPRNGRR